MISSVTLTCNHERTWYDQHGAQYSLSIQLKKLEHCFSVPTKGSRGAAGLDVYAAVDAVVQAHDKLAIPTGVCMAIPRGFEVVIASRSGMFINHHTDTTGTIDSDYRGEVFVMMHNHSALPFNVNRGDRIAQMKVRQVINPIFQEVEELDDTQRGDGRFGHTGR